MASVTLDRAWFHLASDPATFVQVDLRSEEEHHDKGLERRRYAGGRVRSVSRPGSTVTLPLSFDLIDRDDIETLTTWSDEGRLLMFRDPLGRKMFGNLASVRIVEIPGTDGDVTDGVGEFWQVTHDEAV